MTGRDRIERRMRISEWMSYLMLVCVCGIISVAIFAISAMAGLFVWLAVLNTICFVRYRDRARAERELLRGLPFSTGETL